MLSHPPSELSTRRIGLRPKFVLAFVLQTIVVALLIVGLEQWRVRGTIQDELLAKADGLARTVALASDNAVKNGRTDELRAIAENMKSRPWIDYADFVSADGRILAASQGVPPQGITVTPGRTDLRDANDNGLHVFVVPFAGGGSSFRLVANEREANSVLRQLRWSNLGVALLALVVAILLAWIGSRFIIRPILELADNARRLAEGDLTQRAEVKTGDEIGDLGTAFNTMAANLEKTVSKLVRSQTQLKSVVDNVGSRSRTVAEAVDEQRAMIDGTYHSIDQLNNGFRKITDNVEALSASSEETSSSMLQMVASIEEVSRHTDTLYNSVEDTASATGEMVTSINEVDQNVDFLSNFVTDTSSSMVQMSASIAQVEANAARSYDLALAVADAAESGMKAVRETIDGMEQIRHSVAESNGTLRRHWQDSQRHRGHRRADESARTECRNPGGRGGRARQRLLRRRSGDPRSIGAHGLLDAGDREPDSFGAGRSRQRATLHVRRHEARRGRRFAFPRSRQGAQQHPRVVDEGLGDGQRDRRGHTRAGVGKRERDPIHRPATGACQPDQRGDDPASSRLRAHHESCRVDARGDEVRAPGDGRTAFRLNVHEIFQVATSQASESEKIVRTMEQVRAIAEGNRNYAVEMGESLTLLSAAIHGLDEEIRRFRVRG